MFKANDRTTRGFGKSAVLVAVALACVLLPSGCNKPGSSVKNDFDPEVKPTNIPSQVSNFTLKFTGTQGVTLLGFYQVYQPDGTDNVVLLEGEAPPVTVNVTAACLRGVLIRGGTIDTLELEILRDGVVVQRHTCEGARGGVIFRHPEDQG